MIDDDLVRAHRARALDPEHPVVRGTAHNPDTFFQARETVNPFYAALPGIVQAAMDRFAALTGRQYHLFDYDGPAGRRAGAGADGLRRGNGARQRRPRCGRAARRSACCRCGCIGPFAAEAFLAALPRQRARGRGAGADQGAGRDRRAAVSRRRRRRWRRPWRAARARSCRAWSAAATACRRRIFRRRWRRRCSTNWRSRSRATASPSASSTTSRIPASTPTRRFAIDPTRRGRGGVLRPGRGRHGRRQQEQREDHRRGCRPLCAGLLRLRLAQIRRADRFASALRAAADPRAVPDPAGQLRRLPPVQFVERVDVLRLAAPGATFLLNSAVRAGRGVGPPAARDAAAHHRPQAAASS